MTRDVYAGDDFEARDSATSLSEITTRYSIIGDAQPDLLLRVCSQLLLSNELPSKVVLSRQASELAAIEIEIVGLTPLVAESIGRKISQLSCVTEVHFSSV